VSNLDFNLTHLEALICDLRTIKSNFDDAEKFSDEVSAAVGHARLSSKVQDFAGPGNVYLQGQVGASAAAAGRGIRIMEG